MFRELGFEKEALWTPKPKSAFTELKAIADKLDPITDAEVARRAAFDANQGQGWLRKLFFGGTDAAKDMGAVAGELDPVISKGEALRSAIHRAESGTKKQKSHKFALGLGAGAVGGMTVGSLFGKKNQNSPYYPQ